MTPALKTTDDVRVEIARKVRALREGRRLPQRLIAGELGLSQSRFSQIERGDGSFTAEQFLRLLGIFNVGVSHFAPPPADPGVELQNALARFGGTHLREAPAVVVGEHLEQLHEVVIETLIGGDPRHLAALAPVLVVQADDLRLPKLLIDLRDAGLQNRLPWLLENVLAAIRARRAGALSRPWSGLYRRADTVVENFLQSVSPNLLLAQEVAVATHGAPPDLLDRHIRSSRGVREASEESSSISKRWGIVTVLQVEDFVEALRQAHDHD
jgi:transcriptional regulator with XRE-family HTH domain